MVGGDPAPRACHRAAIPAPKVFKYFIPVSHMTVTIVAPGPIRSARRNAAMTLAPVDVEIVLRCTVQWSLPTPGRVELMAWVALLLARTQVREAAAPA